MAAEDIFLEPMAVGQIAHLVDGSHAEERADLPKAAEPSGREGLFC